MKNKLSIAIFAISLLIAGTFSAHAQDMDSAQKNILPIEVKLLYMKLLGQQPSYESIIASNPAYANKSKFGQPAMVEQQRQVLRSIYNKAGKTQPIYLTKTLTINEIDKNKRLIALKEIPADEPVIYTVSPDEKYGLFIRNANKIAQLSPSYEFDNFAELTIQLENQRHEYPAELVVLPVAADPQDFLLADGESLHVILVDVVDVKLFAPTNQAQLIHKRFADIPGQAGSALNSLMQLKELEQPRSLSPVSPR